MQHKDLSFFQGNTLNPKILGHLLVSPPKKTSYSAPANPRPRVLPSPGEVRPVDAVLPGLRGDPPATWLDAAPARGAALGEQVGRAPAPVGAWAPRDRGVHGGSMKSMKSWFRMENPKIG